MSEPLNDAQREAIRYLDGPCLVIAGAGSGKTRVVTHKIRHLVQSGVSGAAIAAITFTNKAAREMQERLAKLVKLPQEQRPTVCTFHSLGAQMLRNDGAALGLKRNFTILDAHDAAAVLQDALATTDRKAARAALHTISLWKNGLIEPEAALAGAANEAQRQVARAYREYAATLTAWQAVDFDDLIRLPLHLMREHPEVAKRWRERLRYVLVDEVQDTNACQYALLSELVGPRAAFTAVGDDDQSIYGWRGADVENLRRLKQDYPALNVIRLEQNYRSSTNILGAANRLIARNEALYPKKLWSALGPGDGISVVASEDDRAEADTIAIRLSAHRFERRSRWSDYAILMRGNHQARGLEEALRREKIPYVLSGGQSFFERAEIRDVLAWVRLLVNPADDAAMLRAVAVPRRGIGAASLRALGEYAGARHVSMLAAIGESGLDGRIAARQLEALRTFGAFVARMQRRATVEPAADVLDSLIGAIDMHGHLRDGTDERTAAARLRNVEDFIGWMKDRASADGATLARLAQNIAILGQLDRRDEDADAVRLSTIHAAKGLEFPHVFVVGCEEGVLPHFGALAAEEADAEETDEAASTGKSRGAPRAGESRSTASVGSEVATSAEEADARIAEERRLMYVAVTRAQRSLTLSWAARRSRGRRKQQQQPSRFLAEMDLQASPAAAAVPTQSSDARNRLAGLREMLAAGRS